MNGHILAGVDTVRAYIAGDGGYLTNPDSVDSALARYARTLRDTLPPEKRALIDERIHRLMTTGDDGRTTERAWLSVDTLVRVITPIWLDVVELTESAKRLRNLVPLTNRETASAAYKCLETIYSKIDEGESDAHYVAEQSTSWAAAHASSGAGAGAFALVAGHTASGALASSGAALARSRGLDVPQSSLDASDVALLDPLTDAEHRVMDLTAEVWNTLVREVVGDGPARDGDLAELAHDIHRIQERVLAQAAARAYPDRYRLLGGHPVGATND